MDVVSMAVGTIFKQSLSLLAHTRAIEEALQLISTSAAVNGIKTCAQHSDLTLTHVSSVVYPAQLLEPTAPPGAPTIWVHRRYGYER